MCIRDRGYSYNWLPAGGNAATANGLTAGTYTVTVTDANGCTTQASTTISEPPELTATATSTDAMCNGGNDGSASVTAFDGTPGYNYLWSPSGGSSAVANMLTAGTYSVTITDANGCTTSTSVTVNE